MTCTLIMSPNPVTLKTDDTVSKAANLLFKHHFRSIPVIDSDGKMVGQFSVHGLLGLMVPKIATMDKGLPRMPWVSDHIKDLQRRLKDCEDQPVEKYADKDYIVLHPDTPLTRTVLGLYHCHDNLPVIDPETDRLVGIISYWDVVSHLLTEKSK